MKKLICTITSGSFEITRPVIYPMLKKYAKKVKADFIPIEDTLHPDNPMLDQFRIGDFLDDYDRLIYFDADLIIRSDCPNLFQIVPQWRRHLQRKHADSEEEHIHRQFRYRWRRHLQLRDVDGEEEHLHRQFCYRWWRYLQHRHTGQYQECLLRQHGRGHLPVGILIPGQAGRAGADHLTSFEPTNYLIPQPR